MNRFAIIAALAVFGLGMTIMPGDSFAEQKAGKRSAATKQNKKNSGSEFGSQAWGTSGFGSQAWGTSGFYSQAWGTSGFGSQVWGKPSTKRQRQN